MIFCGWGSMRMFGSTPRVTSDFMNIAYTMRTGLARRYGQDNADEILVGCIKTVLTCEKEEGKSYEAELIQNLFRAMEEAGEV